MLFFQIALTAVLQLIYISVFIKSCKKGLDLITKEYNVTDMDLNFGFTLQYISNKTFQQWYKVAIANTTL